MEETAFNVLDLPARVPLVPLIGTDFVREYLTESCFVGIPAAAIPVSEFPLVADS